MEYICIGVLVNTHGIKGEIRIISDFKYKSRVFVSGTHLYIGEDKQEVIINSYRPHKNYDMCMFDGYDDILQVEKFKGMKVYINRSDFLNTNEYIDSDLIGMDSYYNNVLIGKVKEIINNNNYKLININDKYIPLNDNFIINIDLVNKKIEFKNLEGLI